MKIGILGGTFNPPHLGHLEMAKFALKKHNLDELWLMPNKETDYKDITISKEHRINMIKLMALEDNKFYYSDYEMNLSGITYTYNTFKNLMIDYPNDDFYFYIGMDSLSSIHTWDNYLKLINMVNICVFPRNGYIDDLGYNVELLNYSPLDISSTLIRSEIKSEYLISSIKEYINKNNLYKEENE